MAEAVHAVLEEMIPELDDLQKRGIFVEKEIKEIVKQRTDFEYNLHRRITEKSHYLRSIEYELNLNALRVLRKKRLGIKRNNLPSDYLMIRRIHFIFTRMLKKFRGDKKLWFQYFEFCKRNKSHRLLKQAFAQALSFHPHSSEIWLEAAKFELEEKSNFKSARVLLQRALRMNLKSQVLWLEYFRLELLFTDKIRSRRKLLGISDLPNNKDTDKMNNFLNYQLPQLVYKNAINEIPNDVHFRLSFAELYRHFPQTEELVETEIIKALLQDEQLGQSENTFDAVAKYYIIPKFTNENFERVCKIYELANEKLKTPAVAVLYIECLASLLDKKSPMNGAKISDACLESISDWLVQIGSQFSSEFDLPSSTIRIVISFMLEKRLYKEALDLSLQVLNKKSNSPEDWIFSIRTHTQCINIKEANINNDVIFNLIEKSLKAHPEHFELWSLRVRFDSLVSSETLEDTFMTAIQKTKPFFRTQIKLNTLFAKWIMKNKDMSFFRSFYKKVIRETPTSLLSSFIKKCIKLETRKFDCLVHVEWLYEKHMSLFPKRIDSYTGYINFLRKHNEYIKANQIYRRAVKFVKFPKLLEKNILIKK